MSTDARVLAPDTARRLRVLAERWADARPTERANYALYLPELCDALGVERPRPASGGGHVAEGTAYQFELPVRSTTRAGGVMSGSVTALASVLRCPACGHAERLARMPNGPPTRAPSACGASRR